MKKDIEKKALQALERQTKQYKRQNDFIKNSYDRVSVTLPKGTKQRIMDTGQSVNAFINDAVMERLNNDKK